jgi:hypothetical protein
MAKDQNEIAIIFGDVKSRSTVSPEPCGRCMASLFGYDNYFVDRWTPQLVEQACRQRVIQTIGIAPIASAALTTGIGLGFLWLAGSFASTTASRSIEAAVAVATIPAGADKPIGCPAEGCLPVTRNIETRPMAQGGTVTLSKKHAANFHLV